jgi:DNA mismatch endonuclease (patch repair protein)
LHVRSLPGVPDIVLPGKRAVILVQGCFWHRHETCRYASTPATRPEFWLRKFSDTVARDQKNLLLLREQGWRVVLVWECELRRAGAQAIAARIVNWLDTPEPLLTLE